MHQFNPTTGLLVDTLGEEGTWTALWDKMEQSMSQLRLVPCSSPAALDTTACSLVRRLSEELMTPHSSTARKGIPYR